MTDHVCYDDCPEDCRLDLPTLIMDGNRDGIAQGRREVLLVLQANLSTPGLSAGDVYANLASYLDSLGYKVWDYDDPENPFAIGGEREWLGTDDE